MASFDHRNQIAALHVAAQIVEELPPGTIFGITVTDDDDYESPSVFNIFAPASEWDRLKRLLLLRTDGPPADQGERFISFRIGPLMVSFQEPEEEKSNE